MVLCALHILSRKNNDKHHMNDQNINQKFLTEQIHKLENRKHLGRDQLQVQRILKTIDVQLFHPLHVVATEQVQKFFGVRILAN